MVFLLGFFALYTLEMWFIGYFAPKRLIEKVYDQSGIYITWASALFAGVCFLLALAETYAFVNPIVETLAPAEDEHASIAYRIASLIETLCWVEVIFFPGICAFSEQDKSHNG